MHGYGDRTRRYTIKPIVQSDTAEYSPPLKGIIILAAGDLKFDDVEGNTVTRTFVAAASGGAYPYTLELHIRRVYDTGTTLTDAQMIGLH
jgi:hypothetical protein